MSKMRTTTAHLFRYDDQLRSLIIVPFAAILLLCMSTHTLKAEEKFSKAKALIGRYGCGACHQIPGVDRAEGRVGPPLIGIGDRVYIAGKLHNSPENMARWIADPQSIVPGNAMPTMQISAEEAVEIANYLETLKSQPRE
jgi:cytochrome c1